MILTLVLFLGMEKKKAKWQIPTFFLKHVFDLKCMHPSTWIPRVFLLYHTMGSVVSNLDAYIWPSFVYIERVERLAEIIWVKLGGYSASGMVSASAAAFSACFPHFVCIILCMDDVYTMAWACTELLFSTHEWWVCMTSHYVI